MKILSVIAIIFILIVIGSLIHSKFIDKPQVKQPQVYQGPLRPTDDVQHFRQTGETIPLEVIS